MSDDKSLFDPFDPQRSKPEGEEKLYITCPHCGIDIPRVTYPQVVFGDFECPNCGAYRSHFDMSTNDGRPGYFMRDGNVVKNYVTHKDYAEWVQRMSRLKIIFETVFTDEQPQLPENTTE